MGGMSELSGVAKTSLGVARMRAAEEARDDPLFVDPYARAFLDAAGVEPSPRDDFLGRLLMFQVVVRTRFYDDYLLGSGCRQVVLLAAGLDARAHRLAWPDGVRVYELDLPEVIDFKGRVLAAVPPSSASLTRIVADLREDWAAPLLAAEFSTTEPTAWLMEGLLIYLSAEDAAALLTRVGELSAPGSTVATEGGGTGNVEVLRALARRTAARTAVAALWKGGLDGDTVGWLQRNGWQTEEHTLAALGETYGRPAPEGVRSGFVTGRRT
jgi:methyltransferase (TIGR00027 family)